MDARPLTEADDAALQELLLEHPARDLFLLGAAEEPLQDRGWVGAWREDALVAAALCLETLIVPTGDEAGARVIGASLAGRVRRGLLIGPRAACDALRQAAGAPTPDLCRDQRLYILRSAATATTPVTWAEPSDLDALIALDAALTASDLPGVERSAAARRAVVLGRIADRRIAVLREAGRVVFAANVGTRHPLGCQIGGVVVAPAARGRGLATRGLRALVAELGRQHPSITLHVAEDNAPAVALYERVGFRAAAAMRLCAWNGAS